MEIDKIEQIVMKTFEWLGIEIIRQDEDYAGLGQVRDEELENFLQRLEQELN